MRSNIVAGILGIMTIVYIYFQLAVSNLEMVC